MDNYSLIQTTTDSKELARKIAKELLDKKLAACIQIIPIESLYTWEQEIKEDKEYLLQIKTISKNYKKIEELILSLHSYSTPEIISIPIYSGFKGYLDWIKDEVI